MGRSSGPFSKKMSATLEIDSLEAPQLVFRVSNMISNFPCELNIGATFLGTR